MGRRGFGWKSMRAWVMRPGDGGSASSITLGHRIAVMVDRSVARELEVWEARPVLAAPVCV